jgi:hypothetical protein
MIGVTGTDGSYTFSALRPGAYTLTETQPTGYLDGKDTPGTPATSVAANDTFAIALPPGTNGANNNFGEIPPAPRVTLVVKTNGTDNNSGTGPSIFVGSTVTWSYDIQNTGNAALSNLTLVDSKAGTIVCPATTLAANASLTCVKTGTAVAGQYINTATVTATDPLGTGVTAQSGDRYLGVADKAKPTCVVKTYKGPPFHGTMTFKDTGSGLASLTVTTNTNFKVTMPAFTRGTTTAVTVSATRVDEKKSAQLVIKAVDVAGNAISCDPVVTTVTKLRQDNGNQTFTGIPYAEHIVTVVNGKPGLRRLNVEVNGVMFAVKKLDDNETQVIDVKSAMRRGTNNTITLVPKGRKGESAEVTIADQ